MCQIVIILEEDRLASQDSSAICQNVVKLVKFVSKLRHMFFELLSKNHLKPLYFVKIDQKSQKNFTMYLVKIDNFN